jgi:hypothetical protein
MYNTYLARGNPKRMFWGTLARPDYWWYSKTTIPSLLVPSLPNMEVCWPSEGAVGSCESIPMWAMVLARHQGYRWLNHSDDQRSKYQQGLLSVARASMWYGYGWICTETMGIYIDRGKRSMKEMDRCPLISLFVLMTSWSSWAPWMNIDTSHNLS